MLSNVLRINGFITDRSQLVDRHHGSYKSSQNVNGQLYSLLKLAK